MGGARRAAAAGAAAALAAAAAATVGWWQFPPATVQGFGPLRAPPKNCERRRALLVPSRGAIPDSIGGEGDDRERKKRTRRVDLPSVPAEVASKTYGQGALDWGTAPSALRQDGEARAQFRRSVDALLRVDSDQPGEILEIMSKQIDSLLTFDCPTFMSEMVAEEGNSSTLETLQNVFDFMLSFMEDYVAEASAVVARHQKTVREIIESAKEGVEVFNTKIEELKEKGAIGYGVLKFLDGEARRLQDLGEEGRDLLGIVMLIRTRVAVELEESMGASAATLSRLLAFDDRTLMRKALNRAFHEMEDEETRESFFMLAKATLQSLSSKPGEADPSLEVKLGHILEDFNSVASRGEF